jgi:hypothetical protein
MIRVFPKRTKWTPDDPMAFVGEPPLFRPDPQPVYISVTFTWDIDEGKRLQRAWSDFYDDVKIGGPAFGDPGDDFVPGMFLKKGVTITSRGCPKACNYCFVSKREGGIRELSIKPGHIIQDNNLLACSTGHVIMVFQMLHDVNKPAIFSGGLDIDYLKPFHVDMMKAIKIDELWFAADSPNSLKSLAKASELLKDFPAYKKRCYVLIGKTDLSEAKNRLEEVYRLGFFPFAQLWQGDQPVQYAKEWRDLARYWSRPAIYNRKSEVE